MKTKTLLLATAMSLGFASQAVAQVNDVNFTASATSGYNFWNKDLNLGQSPFWGAKAGFSFGPVFEISGIYEKSFDLKGKLQGSGWNFIKDLGNDIKGSNAEMERIGGEIRLNVIPVWAITPYLTAGAGVMNIKYDGVNNTTNTTKSYKDEQVYASLGAGLKFNLGRRIALSLEGRDLIFNVNKNNAYLAQGANPNKTLHNWGGRASLDLFLGGHPASKDEISRAYRNQFSDGFRGIKLVLEPGVAYVNFDDKSLFRDQWFMGGSAGIDFNSYLGIRGFYYQATYNPSKLQFDFTKSLKMYGGNFIARLNTRGVNPYLNLGAGYLDVDSKSYNDALNGHSAKSGWFAMGGAGLEIPLGRYVALHGSANAMLNAQDNPDPNQVTELSDVTVNMMYKAGVRINLGARNRDGRTMYQDYATGLVNAEREANMQELNSLRDAKNRELSVLKSDYERKIEELNAKLIEALKKDDVKEVERLVEEKKEVKQAVAKVEEVKQAVAKVEEVKQEIAQASPVAEAPKYKVLTEAQLEALVTRVVKEANGGTNVANGVSQMSDLDKILLFSALANGGVNLYPQATAMMPQAPVSALAPQAVEVKEVEAPQTEVKVPVAEAKEEKLSKEAELEARIKALEAKIEQSKKEMQIKALEAKLKSLEAETATIGQEAKVEPIRIIQVEQGAKKETVEPAKETKSAEQIQVIKVAEDGEVTAKEVEIKQAKTESLFKLASVDPYLGMNFGQATTFNLGARANFELKQTGLFLAPEVLYGFGSEGGFGLYANAIYQMNFLKKALKVVTPYVGVGYGFNNANGTNWGTNILVGAKVNNILGGNLFVDYSIRSLFDNNQIAVGYSINF